MAGGRTGEGRQEEVDLILCFSNFAGVTNDIKLG